MAEYKKCCRYCGAHIFYLVNKNKKYVPCDNGSVRFIPDEGGKDLIYTPDGVEHRGEIVKGKQPGTMIGYSSHFVTCPVSDKERRAIDAKTAAKQKPKKTAPSYEQLSMM